jgi:general stress protein 26
MSKPMTAKNLDLKALILEVLEANRTMAVATIRPDGWPHATIVGYVNDDLVLYFAIARNSQKLANLAHDPRISIAIGGHGQDPHDTRGLSMAATASEVTDVREVARLNALIAARYPEQAIFSPRGAAIAMMRATPEIVSLVHPAAGLAQPALLKVEREMRVSPHTPPEAPPEASGPSWTHG